MNEYPQNSQQFGNNPYQQGQRSQRDDYQQSRPWQEDEWSQRDPYGRERDYERQQRGRDFGSSAQQGGVYQGGTWQQGRGQGENNYRGDYGSQGSYGSMGRWPRNEDRENYGRQQDYSMSNPGYGSDEYRRFENQGRNFYQQQPYYESGQQGGSQWGSRNDFGQSGNWQSGAYGGQQGGGQQGGGQQGNWGQQSGWGGTSSASGRYQPQQSFRGRSPKGYARSDERIKEDICERLTEDSNIDASEISIEVQGGIVTLEGSVNDRMQKHRAEDLVDACSGVKDVHNRLTVSRRDGQGQESGMGDSGMQSTGQTGQGKTTTGTTSTRKQ